MSEAEERALQAYPPKYVKQERHSKRVQSEKVDTHQPMRAIYIKGYRQAEKDLALTWKDVELLININEDINNEEAMTQVRGNKEHYEEVLKRFNKIK